MGVLEDDMERSMEQHFRAAGLCGKGSALRVWRERLYRFVPDCKIYIKFCPMCGRPLTDEAMDIVMKRLEALYE